VATGVFLHAHPDDEAIATGGTMAKAKADGHRVVLVLGTRGEHGEPVPGVLADGEELWQRRVEETYASAEALGVDRVEFLGYRDSGMMGIDTNEHPDSFWQADIAEAAEKLAAILREEQADLLVVYDDHGGYGHPDHIQVHRVGVAAAALAGVDRVYESTMNRDHILRGMSEWTEAGTEADADLQERRREIESGDFGSPEAIITHAVDIAAFVEQKRASMIAHASQIAEDSFFLAMAPEAFTRAFGTEWYIERGAPRDGDEFRREIFPPPSR
jgi:LmbE family N-acetylglucosaminyl deacetylase